MGFLVSNKTLFKEFINSYHTNSKYSKSITKLSKSKEKPPRSAVESSIRLISGDKLKKKINKWLNNNQININEHSSVDGIGHFYDGNKLKLLFVEFKHISKDDKKDLDNMIKKCKKDLKIKPLESLNCVLPHLIDRFCQNEKYCGKEKEFVSYLYSCPKAYICVINDSSPNKLFSQHLMENQDIFDIERLSKHPFDKVETMNPNKFKEFLKIKFNS